MSRPQRNDPCPCGSGKKYKACCMGVDRDIDRTLRVVGGMLSHGEAPWNPAARAADAWEADVVPLAGGFRDEPDAAPAVVMVGAAGFILRADVLGNRPTDVQGRARAVAEAVLAAGRQVGVLPPTLHVRDEPLAGALGPELEPRGIAVVAAPMAELDDAIQSSIEHLMDDRALAFMRTLGSWRETETSPAELAAFHAAAAAFYRTAPWKRVSSDEVLVMTTEGAGTFLAVVMGSGGMEFGLVLYSNEADLDDLYEHDHEPMAALRQMRGYALTVGFERRSRLPRPMQREVASAGWEIAGDAAYPMLYGLRLPGFRVTAEHVRLMTGGLAAVAFDVGGAELPATVREILDRMVIRVEREDEDELPWAELEEAHVIGPTGPNADPGAVLPYVWAADMNEYERLQSAELERAGRFEGWLRERGLSKAAQRRHLRNARTWCEYLAGMAVPAQAATEIDLRNYLYDWFPRKEALPKDVERVIDQSLLVFFGWLEAEEGIGYPWAAAVLHEFGRVSGERGPAPEGAYWEAEVREWRGMFFGDLDDRMMLPDRDLPGTEHGWPAMMNAEIAHLHNELQRRWLIWYDEAVRGGVTDLEELYVTLALRQRGWENTPHPQVGGRTPRQVVAAYEQEQEGTPQLSFADFG
ncbi:MAG TPA: SEC-C domain-containing protein [Longimicrobium sp.]